MVRRASTSAFRAELPALFLAWHALYEDLKLARLQWCHLLPLARLLSALLRSWGGATPPAASAASAFFDLYARDHGAAMALTRGAHAAELQCIAARCEAAGARRALQPLARYAPAPANVMAWMVAACAALRDGANAAARAALAAADGCPWLDALRQQSTRGGGRGSAATRLFGRTQRLCGYFALLLGGDGSARARAERVVVQMARDGFTRAHLDLLPFGICLPLRETLRACGSSPPSAWSAAALRLVGRDDVAELSAERGALRRPTPRPPRLEPRSAGAGAAASSARSAVAGKQKHPRAASDLAGLEWVQEVSKLTFSRDRRIQEVCRLLDSSQKMRLPPIADFDQLDELGRTAKHQEDLVVMCRRVLALPTGRGMLTLGLCPPVSTEVQPVPPMTLEAVASPSGAMVKLDVNQSKELHDMARFHNGCAAALRLAPGVKDVTRTWVLYNKMQSARSSSAAAARDGAMTDDEKVSVFYGPLTLLLFISCESCSPTFDLLLPNISMVTRLTTKRRRRKSRSATNALSTPAFSSASACTATSKC